MERDLLPFLRVCILVPLDLSALGPSTPPALRASLLTVGLADPSVVFTPKIPGEWTVDKVLSTIPTGRPVEQSASPLPYFHLLERLKTTKREGWRRFDIMRCADGLAAAARHR